MGLQRPITEAQIEEFGLNGYILLRQVICPSQVDVYSTYALLQRFTGHYENISETKSKDHYADVLGESLLLHLQPTIEAVCGRKLLPAYSFLRIYQTGSIIEKHTDRPSCEISASMTLGYRSSELWPLWVESRGKTVANTLDGGDLLIYRGSDIPHWRDRFNGRYWIQMFFHYVDAAGHYTDYKFDRRVLLGLPSIYKQSETLGKEDATR